MSKNELLSQFKVICKNTFEDDDLEFNQQTLIEDIEEWDSLNHIHLVVNVEKYFGIKFNTSDLQGVISVGDFINIIDQYYNN